MHGATTRERVRELVAAGPTLNLSGIAERLGVSRERVRQIVTQESLVVAKGVVGYRPRPKRESQPETGYLCETAKGTVGELLVAADLTARGLVVFFPLVRTAECDLVALARRGKPERIEVRCAKRRGGVVRFSKPDTAGYDRLAIVVPGEPVRYEPPFA